MRKKTVLGITLGNMWSIKDYLLSGALKLLSEHFDIVCWVPERFLEVTKQLGEKTGVTGIEFIKDPSAAPTKLSNLVYKFQKSLIFERHDLETERIMQRRSNRANAKYRSLLQNIISRIIRKIAKSPLFGFFDSELENIKRVITPSGIFSEDISKFNINMVFTTNPVVRADDSLYFECLKRNIPVAALVLSWDNLTTRGIISKGFNKVMVWNELMRDEVLQLYPSYEAGQIEITGFPRFDVYYRPLPPDFQREIFLTSLGLNPKARIILLVSSSRLRFKTQNQVFEHVCKAQEEGVFPNDVQVLIRCHPHDSISDYNQFRGRKNIVVWPDAKRGKGGSMFSQPPLLDELLILAASVKYSAACVSAGSTVCLDAAICDIPMISIAYDGDIKLPFDDSVASCYNYSHQKPLHELEATDLCYNREELIYAIQSALLDPKRKSTQRKILVDKFLGNPGHSAEQICKVLSGLEQS